MHEKSGAILLVLLGLTAGRQAGRHAGWKSDEILEISTDYIVRIFMAFNEGTVLLIMLPNAFFSRFFGYSIL